jgi:hypothetical protein
MRKRILLALVPLAVALGACSEFNDDRGIGDAPAAQVDDAAVPVWPGPNGFMNIGAYCIGTDAVYVHTREAAPVVVADSANCEPGGILAGVRPADAGDLEDAEIVQDGSDGEE